MTSISWRRETAVQVVRLDRPAFHQQFADVLLRRNSGERGHLPAAPRDPSGGDPGSPERRNRTDEGASPARHFWNGGRRREYMAPGQRAAPDENLSKLLAGPALLRKRLFPKGCRGDFPSLQGAAPRVLADPRRRPDGVPEGRRGRSGWKPRRRSPPGPPPSCGSAPRPASVGPVLLIERP